VTATPADVLVMIPEEILTTPKVLSSDFTFKLPAENTTPFSI
jgi:hypothetical protein